MKSIGAIFLLIFTSVVLNAQPLEDAKLLFDNQRYSSAETKLHASISSEPINADAWATLIRCYLVQGKLEQASDSLALVPISIKEDPYIQVATAGLLLTKNDTIAAKQLFEEALKKTKSKDSKIIALIAAFNIESANPNYQYAIELLHKTIKRDKKNATLYTLLGQAYRRQMNGSEAYRAFMQAIDKNPQDSKAFYELAKLFGSQGNKELNTEFLNKTIAANPGFAPAYYDLYEQYIYTNPARAKELFALYRQNSDYSLQQDYYYTDLLYLTKSYDSAILAAQQLIASQGTEVQPRLYKLISYSFQEKADTAQALTYMTSFFDKEADTNFIAKDYETMGRLLSATNGKEDSAIMYFEKALALTSTPEERNNLLSKLVYLSKTSKNYEKEAYWLGKVYATDPSANNLTLFNWGLAAFRAKDYTQADSVFGLYVDKYSDQSFGYYWRARVNAAIDTAMEQGLAIPHYKQLIEVLAKDSLTSTNKKWMAEAYGYLATYEANTEKDYAESIQYFEKLLEIDPSNADAEKYIGILEKNLEKQKKNEGQN